MMDYPKTRADNVTRILAGGTAGVLGGLLMMLFLMLNHLFVTGLGLWVPMNTIAAVAGFSLTTDFGLSTLFGLILHIVFTAFLGMILGLTLVRTPGWAMALFSGLIFSLIVFGLAFYVFLPVLSPVLAIYNQTVAMLVAYLLFGMGFIFYPALLEKFS